MSKETIILEQGQNKPKPETDSTRSPQAEAAHMEAMEFFNRHRDFFQHYARGEMTVKPAPPGLNTFAFNLENDEIYLNSRFYQEREFSDEETSFATCHEIEHMLEKKRLLAEPNGARVFERYLAGIKADKAWDLMDNCVADIRENRTVVFRTSQEFQETESRMYRENLFPEADFTSRPRHIQFVEALLNESRLPDRELKVDPEVRVKLDELKAIKSKKGVGLIDAMTHPDLSMADRFRLQDHFIWPIVEELRQKDIEDRKNQPKKGGGKGSGKGGEPKEGEKPNPNDVFADDYADASRRTPNAVPVEDLEKAFKEWKKSRGEDPLDRADKDYASKIGVKPEDLRRYREIVRSLDKIIDPETNERVIEELRNIFAKIIAKRSKSVPGPRYPVEEGEDLVDPAGLVSGVKGGDLEPKVWETIEMTQRLGKRFGEIEITLVCDRSGSMAQDGKLSEQRKAAVLVMEALKEFNDLLDEEQANLTRPLKVRSEIYSFQATDQDSRPLKAMSKELTEKERINTAGILSSAPGQYTTDYISLEAIDKSINDDTRLKIKEGNLKKIVIVFTDGISSDVNRVKTVTEKMRKEGIVAIGVGITKAGQPAVETYAPDARLAEKAEDLAKVLKDLLKEHLADI